MLMFVLDERLSSIIAVIQYNDFVYICFETKLRNARNSEL